MAYTGGVKMPALLKWLWSRQAQAFDAPERAAVIDDRVQEADCERLPDRDESYFWLSYSYLHW